jgi:hypothetical protein
VRFLVDTGASHTCITPAIALQANLRLLGLVPVHSTTQQVLANTYLADMLLPIGSPGYFIRDVQLSELKLAGRFWDGLLGRDWLCKGHLFIDGLARTFTITI